MSSGGIGQYNYDAQAQGQNTQSQTLSNIPEQKTVIPGPDGTFVTITAPLEGGIIGPSQGGLGRGETESATVTADIFAGAPVLTPGILLDSCGSPGEASMTTWATGFFTTTTPTTTEEAPDTISFYAASTDALAEGEPPRNFSALSPPITNGTFGLDEEADYVPPKNLGDQCADTLAHGILSATKEDVLNSLAGLIDIDSLPLTTDQKNALKGKLALVAEDIAGRDDSDSLKQGLMSSDSKTVFTALKALFSKQYSDQESDELADTLTDASVSIASMNAACGTKVPDNPLYTQMNSTDAGEVLKALTALVPKDQLAEVQASLENLAAQIAVNNKTGKPYGIDSANADTLRATLAKCLGYDDPDLVTGVLAQVLSGISQQYAKINLARYNEMVNSTDPTIVKQGLMGLSNINYDKSLSTQEKTAALDYLSILSKALAFMSTVRASITIMEGKIKQLEAQGKLAQIESMTKVAQGVFTKSLSDISQNLTSEIEQKKHEELMTWLMPLITAVVALISIAITVATLGIAGPLAIALIAVTVAMTTFTIVEQTTHCVTNALQSAGITDPVQQAAINFAIQLAITILVGAATFGAALPAMAANVAARGALVITGEAVAMGMMAASTLLSSGLISAGFTELFKKIPGVSEEVASYLAMAVTMLLSLVMIIVSIKFAASTADAVKKTATAGEEAVDDAAKGVGTTVKTGADAATTAATTATSTAQEGGQITQTLQNLARRLKELFTEPNTYVQVLRVVELGAKVSADAYTINYEVNMAKISQQRANLASELASAQALIKYLEGLLGSFDLNMDGLNKDGEAMVEYIGSWITFSKQFYASQTRIVEQMSA